MPRDVRFDAIVLALCGAGPFIACGTHSTVDGNADGSVGPGGASAGGMFNAGSGGIASGGLPSQSSGGAGIGGAVGSGGAVVGGTGNSQGGSGVGGTSTGGAGPSGGTANGGTAGAGGSGGSPSTVCAPLLTLVDVSRPAHVVGNGTPGSCTDSALRAAATQGGVVTFDCGGPATIQVTSQIDLPTNVDTTLDGGGQITLDGGGTTRILSFNDGNYRTLRTTVTLQRITLSHGKSSGTQIASAPPPCSQGTKPDGGGSAIFVRNGVLHVIDSTFSANDAPSVGPDVGGAAYALGSLEVIVQGSTFDSNTGANGGALYTLQSDLKVVNSTFTRNQALGTGTNYIDNSCAVNGGESGNGGNGAAITIDGGDDGDDTFCGDVFSGNQGNELGTVFRTPDGAVRDTTFDRVTFDGNRTGNGGALYFHHSNLHVVASTFSNNSAKGSGAVQADDTTLDFSNVTFAGNSATSGLGGAIALFGNGGTLVNCTFANNTAEGGSGLFGAAIAGDTSLTLQNSLFSNDTTKDCGAPMACADGTSTGDGDLQWPSTHTVCTDADQKCTGTTTFADPQLGALADNGGPTRTLLPAATSPAKGVGQNCPNVDQRGLARPTSGCTAGSVEP